MVIMALGKGQEAAKHLTPPPPPSRSHVHPKSTAIWNICTEVYCHLYFPPSHQSLQDLIWVEKWDKNTKNELMFPSGSRGCDKGVTQLTRQ